MQRDDVDNSRRRFLTAVTTLVGGVGAAYVAVPFLGSWAPSAKALAMGAPVEIDVSKLEPGAQLTVAWRGKPVQVIRRTKEMLATLETLVPELRDPNSEENQQPAYAKNPHRSIKEEFLVIVGLCTHLGCVPTYRPDLGGVTATWAGGFYCPCHGSTYDLAGRVYKGVPAPLNLPVPPHRYVQDTVVLVGEDAEGTL